MTIQTPRFLGGAFGQLVTYAKAPVHGALEGQSAIELRRRRRRRRHKPVLAVAAGPRATFY